jgi:phasin
VNEADTNEANANPKATTSEQRSSNLPFLTVPGLFDGIAEQNLKNIEKMKTASGTISNVLREAYSTNAKGSANYAAKIVEFSVANTSSAFDFLSHLMSAKSPSEILQLSAAQGCKNFEATTAQSRELWQLARKVATETAEPIKKGFAGALQKAA